MQTRCHVHRTISIAYCLARPAGLAVLPGTLSVGLRAWLLCSRGMDGWMTMSQLGPNAPFHRAGEPVQDCPGRGRKGLRVWEISWVLSSYLLFEAEEEG